MRPWSLVLATLLGAAHPAALPERESSSANYDAVIIGGGPAGLSALSGLARVRRNVLLLDSGEYRNGPTRHMHDVIGFDGVTPAYFRWAAREQIAHYDTVEAANGTVESIQGGDGEFIVLTEDGLNVTARKVVLATGLRDVLPATPGIRENWGKGIFWCPWCDGHEHADQPLGLLGSLSDAPGSVREMATLNNDVVALVNGTDTPEMRAATEEKFPRWEEYLRLHNVTVDNRTITRVTRLRDGGDKDADPSLPSVPEFDLFRVDFADGPSIERAAFLASFPDEQASPVGAQIGVNLYGGRLAADGARGLVTNVAGVYAVGDANSDNVTNVPHAVFSGKRTAVYLHVQLAREDAADELGSQKRDVDEEARDLWARVNDDPRDLLYGGEFDQ